MHDFGQCGVGSALSHLAHRARAYQRFDEEAGVVLLQMQGSCSGCPSSSVTLKSGIENMLMHYIPEVSEVRAITEEEEEEAFSPTNLKA